MCGERLDWERLRTQNQSDVIKAVRFAYRGE